MQNTSRPSGWTHDIQLRAWLCRIMRRSKSALYTPINRPANMGSNSSHTSPHLGASWSISGRIPCTAMASGWIEPAGLTKVSARTVPSWSMTAISNILSFGPVPVVSVSRYTGLSWMRSRARWIAPLRADVLMS